jgi:hypothetical protein
MRVQPIAGVVPPQLGEALIREVWPSVARVPTVAGLGRLLIRSILGAPLGWLLLAPFYFVKILPGFAIRYTLTNRRLMLQRGLKAHPTHEVALADIDEVRIERDSNSDFFRAGNIQIISKGNVGLVLKGVPEPESFRHSIVQAYSAWVPGKKIGAFVPAKAPG